MFREIHRYIWLSNWFMGRGLKKRTDGRTDRQNNVDFNIDNGAPTVFLLIYSRTAAVLDLGIQNNLLSLDVVSGDSPLVGESNIDRFWDSDLV